MEYTIHGATVQIDGICGMYQQRDLSVFRSIPLDHLADSLNHGSRDDALEMLRIFFIESTRQCCILTIDEMWGVIDRDPIFEANAQEVAPIRSRIKNTLEFTNLALQALRGN